MLGCGGVSDVLPSSQPEGWAMPIRQCVIVAMGVHLLDNLRLDRLAAACSRHGRWSFVGATGSPVNPIALL